MPRTVYTMLGTADGTALESRHGPDGACTLGAVSAASYLGASVPGFFRRMFGGQSSLVLTPPFDRDGNDLLDLMAGEHEPLEERAPIGSVRLARGLVACLTPRQPGDAVVLRDAWQHESPAIRVVSTISFALDTGRGPPIAIAFAQSPLVVAPGSLAPLSSVLVHVDPAIASRLTQRGGIDWSAAADFTQLQEGDTVEALGVVGEPKERPDLAGASVSYRDAPSALQLVLGDAPGMRMVLRRVA